MSPTIWFNGKFIAETLPVDAFDRGLLLGDGVFETIAVFNAKAIWIDDHLERLLEGAAALGIQVDRSTVETGVKAVLSQAKDRHGILRVTLTRGPRGRGLAADGSRPSLLVTLSPWAKRTFLAPVKLALASIRRNETSPASRLKTLSYVDNILAARQAAAKGCDDALLLNASGHVASTTIANIFILKRGRLSTPRLNDGVLPGIARKTLLALTRGEERKIAPTELAEADAVFLTNSLRLIRPVHALDGTTLGRDDAALAGLFEKLCDLIAEESGIDPRQIDAL